MYKRRKILMVGIFSVLFFLILASSAVPAALASNHEASSSSVASPQLTVDRNSRQAFDIAVTPEGFDNMSGILDTLGYAWTEISLADLNDSTVLSQYDAVFINCDWDNDDYTYANDTLRSYVQNGGIVYASDWAFSIIEATFPDKIEFIYETDALYTYDDSRIGETGTVTADILSAGMSAYFGVSTIDIAFDLGGWVVMDSVASDVDILLAGNVNYTDWETWEEVQSYEPITVEYTVGSGSVIYTSFHFEGQEEATAVQLMQYLVFKVLTEGVAQEIIDDLEDQGYEIAADIRGAVNESQTVSFEIEIDPTEVIFVLDWPNDATSLTVKVIPPSGGAVEGTGIKPTNVTIEDASTGTYIVNVTGAANVQINEPFVVVIGKIGEEVPEFNAYFMVLTTIMVSLTGMIVIMRRAKFSKLS